jgi:hypothetical protein
VNDRQRTIGVDVILIFLRNSPRRPQSAEQQQHVRTQDLGQLGGGFFFCQLPLERVVVQQLQFGRTAAMAPGKCFEPGEMTAELIGKCSGQSVRAGVEPVQASLPGCDGCRRHLRRNGAQNGVLKRSMAALEKLSSACVHAQIGFA